MSLESNIQWGRSDTTFIKHHWNIKEILNIWKSLNSKMYYSSFKKSCPLIVTSFIESTLCLQSGIGHLAASTCMLHGITLHQ